MGLKRYGATWARGQWVQGQWVRDRVGVESWPCRRRCDAGSGLNGVGWGRSKLDPGSNRGQFEVDLDRSGDRSKDDPGSMWRRCGVESGVESGAESGVESGVDPGPIRGRLRAGFASMSDQLRIGPRSIWGRIGPPPTELSLLAPAHSPIRAHGGGETTTTTDARHRHPSALNAPAACERSAPVAPSALKGATPQNGGSSTGRRATPGPSCPWPKTWHAPGSSTEMSLRQTGAKRGPPGVPAWPHPATPRTPGLCRFPHPSAAAAPAASETRSVPSSHA